MDYGLEKTNSAFVESYRKQMNAASLIENRDFTLSTRHIFGIYCPSALAGWGYCEPVPQKDMSISKHLQGYGKTE